ncbi:metallophosphoesterase [Desulfurobacterium atlanticum]|uniref:Phosphoesterase n=1 Tax=Desulfurobacterium atlanticum TaxID=240169 RepID=A0A238XLE0_9BACT|nr:metallophosphoesterase [Desulfurobacterium atlanticum]SNR59492.1 hypothetical protein SAMN06265340_10171 [Desulfurobacterium atlanticum]
MRVAVISDSHDNIEKIEKCIEKINKIDVDTVVHCGDIISPFSLKRFKTLKAEFVAVFGNNDGEIKGLLNVAPDLENPPVKTNLNGKTAIIMHEPIFIDELSGTVDFIFYGHTHRIDIREEKGTVIINPGELCGYLTGNSTFVILNLLNGETEIVEI